MEASSPPPSLVLQCSFRSVLPAGVRPHLRDGWGMAAEGVGSAPDSPLLFFFFFFLTTNPLPQLGFPPVSMAIAVQGEGLLAILSTDCLFQICYCSFPRVEGGRLEP